MTYQVRIVTKQGTPTVLGPPIRSLERAIKVACPALRHGAVDAQVVDEGGNIIADLEAIKRHGGLSLPL